MSKIEALLAKIPHCKKTGNDKWLARCTAHDDKSPSLAIKLKPDGRILLKCFAGCGAIDVLESIGMEWGDLMPEDHFEATPNRFNKGRDELYLEIAKADRAKGRILTDKEKAEELAAFMRKRR